MLDKRKFAGPWPRACETLSRSGFGIGIGEGLPSPLTPLPWALGLGICFLDPPSKVGVILLFDIEKKAYKGLQRDLEERCEREECHRSSVHVLMHRNGTYSPGNTFYLIF